MLPALRLGFIAAPEWAMRTLVAVKNCLDWHCATPLQLGVAEFIAAGELARHVRKMRELYKERRQLMLELLRTELCEWLEPIASFYGMHVAAVARGSLDLELVAEALLRRNVKIHTLSRYYLGPKTRQGLLFGYGAADLAQIRRGASLLRAALQG
jgi:GntR family transcriptional regulator/MocR family aminotransferase